MAGNKSFCNTSNALIAPITLTAGGTATIVGVSGQTMSVLFICLGFSTAGTVKLTAPGWAGTGAIGVGTGSPLVLDHHDNPLIIPAGQTLTFTSVSSVGAGYVMYTQGTT